MDVKIYVYNSSISRVKTQAEQVDHCLRNVRRYTDPLDQ